MIYKDRHTLYPIVFKSLFDLYRTHVEAVWTTDELDLMQDIDHLAKMTEQERHLILQILAFFAQSDSIVNENLALRFMQDVNIPEMLQFYSFQIGMEAIHSETYAEMINTYIPNDEEKDKLFNAVNNFPTIAKKADWMKKWIKSQENFSKRLLGFALVEGVFFSGSFCAIYWLKDKGKMPGLSQANDYIARDEALHFRAAATLYKELLILDGKMKQKQFYVNSRLMELDDAEIGRTMKEIQYIKKTMGKDEFKRLQEDEVHQIVKEAVAIEKEFVTDCLPVKLLGINSDLMCQYIEYVADIVVELFGFNKIFNSKQPFDFMIKNDIRGKTNFFEGKGTEYKTAKRESVKFDKVNDDF